MKRKILLFIFTILIILPYQIDAASITGVTIEPIPEQNVGSYFNLPVTISFSGIEKEKEDTSGIASVVLGFEFDNSILEITDIKVDGFDSDIYKYENDYYLLISTVSENSTSDKCIDGLLSCGNYSANIEFYVKNNSSSSTNIKLIATVVGIFDIDTSLLSYENEDAIKILTYENQVIRKVAIKQTENVETKEDVISIVKTDSLPDNSNNILKKVEEINDGKSNENFSSNNNLKSLSIENYEINFDSSKLEYEITINDKIESLNILAETEDSKAAYKVYGANFLDDKVEIVVTAENGDEKTYTINLNRNIEKEKSSAPVDSKIINKTNKVVLIISAIVVVIIIIVFIVSHHSNKKLDRMLDKF